MEELGEMERGGGGKGCVVVGGSLFVVGRLSFFGRWRFGRVCKVLHPIQVPLNEDVVGCKAFHDFHLEAPQDRINRF